METREMTAPSTGARGVGPTDDGPPRRGDLATEARRARTQGVPDLGDQQGADLPPRRHHQRLAGESTLPRRVDDQGLHAIVEVGLGVVGAVADADGHVRVALLDLGNEVPLEGAPRLPDVIVARE